MNKEILTQFKDVDVSVLLSFIAEGMIMFDSDGYITILNPHASLSLDYTMDELVGKKLDEIIPIYLNDKSVTPDNCIAKTVTRGDVFSVPYGDTLYFESRNGKKFPVFASAKPITLTKESVSKKGGVLVFRDITTEKELERYKESTAKTLSELTPILQKTATGDFSNYPELPKVENEFTELLVGLRLMLDDLQELELERQKNEKERLNTLEEKRLLTEKYSKELEQKVDNKTIELLDAKKHIEIVIESLTNGLVEYDSNNQIIRLNRAAEKILGVDKEFIVGREILKDDLKLISLSSIALVTHPSLCEDLKSVSRDVSGVDADVFELTIKYPIERNIQVASVPVTGVGQGDRMGTLKIIRDVTREKLISRSKSEFISIAAHQLRTPLSGIKWSLHLLLSGDFGKLKKDQQEIINEAFGTNEKMISLVNDLLNVARIEDGRFGYEFKKGNFSDLVEQLVDVSKSHAREKNIELNFTNNSNGLVEFVFDQSKISVALQNLIDNAVKYTRKGGKVEVVLTNNDELAQVDVIDNGVGVPENQIERLFTKFFRAENVTSLPVSGSGLGLFITRNIIVRHGGDIQVHSKEGKGTTFTVMLPTNESKIPAKEEVAASLYE